MSENKGLLEEWQERQYMAYVNFLRKKELFEEWKAFKAGKGRLDQYKLMLDFLNRVERRQQSA